MTNIQIFDPAMCCSSGACGPRVDPELARVAAAVYSLEQKGADIQRFNLASEPGAFVDNETVNAILQEKGPGILPLILRDGEVVKERMYPTNEEFAEWFKVDASGLNEKPRMRVEVNVDL